MATLSRAQLFLTGTGVSIAIALTLAATIAILRPDRVAHQCLRLRDGTAQVVVRYPDAFTPIDWLFNSGDIQIVKDVDGADPENLLIVYARSYMPIDSLLNKGGVDPGPVYNQITFNGREAAFSQDSDGDQFYRVPAGNRVIGIDYFPSRLTNPERQEAERMLQGVAITQVPEDYQGRTVRPCDQ